MSAKPVLAVASIPALPTRRPASTWATSACLLAADLAGLSLVFWLAVLTRHAVDPGYPLSFYLGLFPCLVLFLVAFFTQDLYPAVLLHPADEIRRVFHCITIVCLVLAAGTFFLRNAESYSRSVLLTTWLCAAPAVLLSRYFMRRLCAGRHWWGIPVVVFASGATSRRIIDSLQKSQLGLRLAAILGQEDLPPWASDGVSPLRGHFSMASELAKAKIAQYAIIVTSQGNNKELRQMIQHYCKGFRHVLVVPGLTGLCSHGICAREVGGELGFEFPQQLFHRGSGWLKRGLDIVLSTVLVTLLLPVFLFLCVAIKLTSGGSIFYGQKRYGRNGELFRAFKFRTMVQNADQVLVDHLRLHPEHLLEWQRDHKLKEDPRVTPVGKWLRRYSLDELPQLWNVLTGEMSLVGPRPIVHDEIRKYGNSGYDLYTRVLPGITGLWQVSGRNNTTYGERVAYDEYYVRNWSIWLDAYILARTVKTVLMAEGAY
jgi:Undecaprenyl-phosphate galactose phosphotransferase WbaP